MRAEECARKDTNGLILWRIVCRGCRNNLPQTAIRKYMHPAIRRMFKKVSSSFGFILFISLFLSFNISAIKKHTGTAGRILYGYTERTLKRKTFECQLVVVSAVFGGYDSINIPRIQLYEDFTYNDEHIRVYASLVTDNWTWAMTKTHVKEFYTSSERENVKLVVLEEMPFPDLSLVFNVRCVKVMLHKLFPGVRYSLFIDGKIELKKSVQEVFATHLRGNPIVTLQHSYSLNTYQTLLLELKAGNYCEETLAQLEKYARAGYMGTGAIDSCFIFRRHNEEVDRFFDSWWEEMLDTGNPREQNSFFFVLDKQNGRPLLTLLDGSIRWNNALSFLQWKKHVQRKAPPSDGPFRKGERRYLCVTPSELEKIFSAPGVTLPHKLLHNSIKIVS